MLEELCCGHRWNAVSQPRKRGGWYLDEKWLSFWKAAHLTFRNWEVWENQDPFPGRPVLLQYL